MSSNGKEQSRRSSHQYGNGAKEALKERTSSSLNVSQKRQPNGQAKLNSPESGSKQKQYRAPSTASTPSIPHGTVQFQASPAKENNIYDTPEWKRRIVQGKIGAGDQTDMFGPMGLQSVFKPPTVASTPPQQKKKFQPQAPAAPEMPSSPPPHSSPSMHSSISQADDPIKPVTPGAAQKQLNDEEELGQSVLVHPENKIVAGGEASVNSRLPLRPVMRQYSSAKVPESSTTKAASSGGDSSLSYNGSDHSKNEDFTPFYVSKSHTIDGRVDYAAIDTSMKRIHSNMEKLRQQQQNNPSSRSGEDEQDHSCTESAPGISFRQSQINEISSQSLPEDLSVGTDAFAANGGFISVRRGGYSDKASFQKRPFSPSSSSNMDGPSANFARASSEALPSPELQRPFQQLQRRSSTPPRTPRKNDTSTGSSRDRPRSSGSPLKLFDKYDTFTNNRLARHISRFEETLAQDEVPQESAEDGVQPLSPSPGPKVRRKVSQPQGSVEHRPGRRISSFGDGELDEHEFYTDGQSGVEAPSLPHWSPEDRDAEPLPPRRRRNKKISRTRDSKPSSLKEQDRRERTSEDVHFPGDEKSVLQPNQRTQEVSYTAHGKRLAHSPVKDPVSKRRRTICSSEERKRASLAAHPSYMNPEVKETPVASGYSRKRKDARYDSEKQAADPNIIARRQILRPRNPTPSQTASSARQTPLIKVDDAHVEESQQRRNRHGDTASASKVDPPTHIVAGALATIALNTVQDLEAGSRKASVTTSDFFNEAQQIMALIRAQKRPTSSHNTAETFEVGPSFIPEESYTGESTKDNFSRPPSREGGSLRKLQPPMQIDARAVSHLRKFEDDDDLGLALPSSMRSLKTSHCELATEDCPAMPIYREPEDSPARPIYGEHESDAESDPPNIRILERLFEAQQHEHLPPITYHTDPKVRSGHQKADSQGSSGTSTGQSGKTGSSRSSVNMKQIAPQSVAHLLSDQMADMMFDKERKVWIKRKVSADSADLDPEGHRTSDGTEDNLFGDIPDLSVDEMEELRRVKEAVSSGNTLSLGGSTTSKHDHAPQQAARKVGPDPQASNRDDRPRTADGKIIPPADDSSAPSKFSHFAWSGPMPGTRATSYGDDVWLDKVAQPQHNPLLAQEDGQIPVHGEEAEHEFSMQEGRESRVPAQANNRHRQPRVVTVAFSSPLIQSPYPQDEDLEGGDDSRLEESPSRSASQQHSSTKRPTSSGFSRGQRRASRRMSVGNSSFIARPMSRLDEQDEMSLVHYSVKRPSDNIDLAVSTPLPLSRSLVVPPTTGQRSSIGFKLSPLPDFTVHQIDRPLDTEEGAVVRQRRPGTTREASNALSLTAQELVKHLTDMEPYEPYWDHLPSVDLKDRGLTSLHMLDEFCGRTQALDVSKNCIRELDGVPSTVRSLNIRSNCLSDLTAWHTLLHLQYLDVSSNQLRSLKGLQGLMHLRGLKADDNEIENLDGIQHLDGLLSLSLRGNHLRSVNFEKTVL